VISPASLRNSKPLPVFGRLILVAVIATSAVGLDACFSSPAATGTTKTGTTKLVLSAADNGRTISVRVPVDVTVVLPYDPASGNVWELSSGGAGFITTQSTKLTPPAGRIPGKQTFYLRLKLRHIQPVVFDDVPAGTLPNNPQQFSVTLKGQ
jgi:predicted secreted protein